MFKSQKIINKHSQKYLIERSPLILAIIYAISIYFFPVIFYFSGIIAILILLLSLKKWETYKVLLLLSPLVSFPIYLFSEFQVPGYRLTLAILLYAILYGILFFDLKNWIQAKKLLYSITGLIIISITTLFYGAFIPQCYDVREGGKGITQEEVYKCKVINLYNKNAPSRYHMDRRFSFLQEDLVKALSQGVGFTSMIVALTLFFSTSNSYLKDRKKLLSGKRNKKQ
jgi:hypothetical protein